MTYKKRFGNYEVRTAEITKWFVNIEKAEAYFDEMVEGLTEDLRDLEEADTVELVDLRSGEVLRTEKIDFTEKEAEAQTIQEWVVEKELKQYEERLEKLEEMGAPAVMVEGQRKAVEHLRKGEIKVGGRQELLKVKVESYEVKKGNGGKVYIEFNGNIRYFPQARYGRYITA